MEANLEGDGLVVASGPVRDALDAAAHPAALAERDGVLVASGETRVDDAVVLDLIDAGRR